MRKKNLQGMFNLIDDEILEEADPTKRRKPTISKYIWLQIATAAACLILTLNLFVVLPVLLLEDDDKGGTPSTDVIDGDYDKFPGFEPDTDKDSVTVESEKESDLEDTKDTETADKEVNTDTEISSDTEIDIETEAGTDMEINTDTEIITDTSADTSVDTSADTSVDTSEDTSADTSVDTSEDTSADTSVDTSTDIGIDTSVGAETDIIIDTSTDIIPDTDIGTDDKKDENVKIEYIQNITNIHITVSGKETNVITLSSPLLGAPSEYDEIVKSMQAISDGRLDILDKDDDNFTDLEDKIEDETKEEIKDSMDSSSNSNKYQETTDLQVEGVLEGDIIKRSDKYIYYLSGSDLRVYSTGMNAKLVALFSIQEYIDEVKKTMEIPESKDNEDIIEDFIVATAANEMFLSPDCKTVTIIYDDYVRIPKEYEYDIIIKDDLSSALDRDGNLHYTAMVSLNVEDTDNIHLSGITTMFGRFKSARYVDGEYLVFTTYTPNRGDLIVPQYNDGEGFKLFPIDKIAEPSKYTCENYLLAYRLNDSCKVIDLGAYASFDGHIYVSGDNFYLTREYWEDLRIEEPEPEEDVKEEIEDVIVDQLPEEDTYLVESLVTEIIRISYENGEFVNYGTVKVDGYLKDRYSLSENDTVLYVVTTEWGKYSSSPYNADILADWFYGKRNASIYCVDTVNMEILSSVKRFAPEGEIVRAVQFDGFYAYVCTSVLVTDPVFFFNLNDPSNITYADTGTIPGFSTSLIELGNGVLLGIGEDESGNTKVEIYEEGENNTVNIVDTYIIKGTYSTDYKSYYINREYGLFGFGLFDSSQEDASRYVMLQYRNGNLTEIFNKTLRGVNYSKRAVFDGSYFYLVSANDFTYFKRVVKKP